MKLAFLGAGNMAGAMIQSILAADVLKGDEILLVNARNPAHGKETAARLGITAAEPAALRTADAIVFAMKPQDFSAAAAMYRSYLENQLVLSIMAGISFKKLEKELGALPFIRVMPNMGVSVRLRKYTSSTTSVSATRYRFPPCTDTAPVTSWKPFSRTSRRRSRTNTTLTPSK